MLNAFMRFGLLELSTHVFCRTECRKCDKMAALSVEIAVNCNLVRKLSLVFNKII